MKNVKKIEKINFAKMKLDFVNFVKHETITTVSIKKLKVSILCKKLHINEFDKLKEKNKSFLNYFITALIYL